MKREILIITVLITNIAFGATLPVKNRVVREIDTNKKNIHTLVGSVSRYLYKKGLDKSEAERKVLRSLGGDEYTNSLMAQNIVDGLSEIENDDIIAYIGDCALFGKSVSLSSYEDIIALLQKKNRFYLDESVLEKVRQISLQNRNISSASRLS